MSTYHKVAVAGATGNLGPTLVSELVSAGFEVTVLTRSGKTDKLPNSVKSVKVDYSSQDSLTAVLKGQDALVCNLPNHKDQPSLIDAAIAAGVKRYIPSEFGSNVSGNTKTAALPVFQGKLLTQEYLHKKSADISWTVIVTGLFLDWGVQVGFWINLNGPTRVFDGGNAQHSTTRLSDIGKAVAGILQHPEETKNRTVYVQSASVSQNQLLEVAKKVKPGFELQVEQVDTVDLEKQTYELLQKGGENIRPAMINFIVVSVFNSDFGNNWAQKNDNELLGIKELTEEELEEVVEHDIASGVREALRPALSEGEAMVKQEAITVSAKLEDGAAPDPQAKTPITINAGPSQDITQSDFAQVEVVDPNLDEQLANLHLETKTEQLRPAYEDDTPAILRHSHGPVYYKGPATNVAITVLSDQPPPPDRKLWLQKRGFSGRTGLTVGAVLVTRSAWVDVTPAIETVANLLPHADELAWQRDIAKFLKKAKDAKHLRNHRPHETNIIRIPHAAEDGYFGYDEQQGLSYQVVGDDTAAGAEATEEGDEIGPQAPFPIRLWGGVLRTNDKRRKWHCIPTADLGGVPEGTLLRLSSGVYVGWASISTSKTNAESNKNAWLPADAYDKWYKAVAIVSPMRDKPAKVVEQKQLGINLMHDFCEATFFDMNLDILLRAFVASNTAAKDDTGDMDAKQQQLSTGIPVARSLLRQPAWSADSPNPDQVVRNKSIPHRPTR